MFQQVNLDNLFDVKEPKFKQDYLDILFNTYPAIFPEELMILHEETKIKKDKNHGHKLQKYKEKLKLIQAKKAASQSRRFGGTGKASKLIKVFTESPEDVDSSSVNSKDSEPTKARKRAKLAKLQKRQKDEEAKERLLKDDFLKENSDGDYSGSGGGDYDE